MRPLLAARLSRALVACYPPRWKQRYQEEILDVLDQHRASPRTVLSLASGAMTAHLDPSYRMEKPVIRIKNNAVRAVLIVVGGCTAVIALLYGLFTYTNLQQLIGDLVWHPGYADGDIALVLTPDQRLLATEASGEPDTAARAGPGRPHHRRRLGVRPHCGRPVGAASRRRVAAVHPARPLAPWRDNSACCPSSGARGSRQRQLTAHPAWIPHPSVTPTRKDR